MCFELLKTKVTTDSCIVMQGSFTNKQEVRAQGHIRQS